MVLVFELPARALGLKSLPAQPGVGVCELTFEARPGRQYDLVARPLGDFNSPRWRGDWEAWVRDPAIASDDDVIARCEGTEPTETPTPLVAGGAAAAAPAAGVAAGVAVPAVAVAVPAPTPLPLPVAPALRVVRPCARPSPVALCLESIDGPADAAHPLLLQIPPAGGPR